MQQGVGIFFLSLDIGSIKIQPFIAIGLAKYTKLINYFCRRLYYGGRNNFK
jgi:hypothetical protein